MDFTAIRQSSLEVAKKLGYELPNALPLLDATSVLRSSSEVVNRALSLCAVVAASFGFNREKAIVWIEREGLLSVLTQREQVYLLTGNGPVTLFRDQVEGLCALTWALGLLGSLDFGKESPNHLVRIFPDLKATETCKRFREKANLRPHSEIVAACDIAYCLHWAIVQAVVDGNPSSGMVPNYVVVERRWALEWILSTDEWDDVSLDT